MMLTISRPQTMFAEDLPQRDRPNNLSRESQMEDGIAVASNHIWIDRRGLYDDPAMAMPAGDHVPGFRGRDPWRKVRLAPYRHDDRLPVSSPLVAKEHCHTPSSIPQLHRVKSRHLERGGSGVSEHVVNLRGVGIVSEDARSEHQRISGSRPGPVPEEWEAA
ncbi:hypothetical protein J3459_017214 [Metarhizium acridum]|nr:hypothetical protein J3459_017214 [Metarhizium acridum]